MKRITPDNYREDRHYGRIVAAVERILQREREVRPLDVFVEVELLSRAAADDWRAGRVPYLEKVIHCNLAKAGRILRILRMHAHDLNLSSKVVGYRHKARRLRFSKSGDRGVEEAYARHFQVVGRAGPRAPRVRDVLDSAS